MSKSKFGPDAIMEDVVAVLKKRGVSAYIVVLDDPDSDQFIFHREGARLWGIGAADYARYCTERTLFEDKEELD